MRDCAFLARAFDHAEP